MAELPQKTPPPEQMLWGIAYLREDIQDLRAANVRLDTKVDERFAQLEDRNEARFAKIDDRFGQLENRMDARFAEIDVRFAEVDVRLGRIVDRVDALHQIVRQQGTVLTQRMLMMMGLMTTVLLAAMKL